MRKNQNTMITGEKVILVPYESYHVPTYHEWMKSSELQKLTASEPLSLEDEYKMQQSWREDDNKCTFIILDKQIYKDTDTEIDAMVGDVNLFFNDEADFSTAEIEIMIAERNARHKGFGKEALFSMMRYAFEDLEVKEITAKIGFDNQPSMSMFSNIGFKEVSRSDVFEEVTLAYSLTNGAVEQIMQHTHSYNKENYK